MIGCGFLRFGVLGDCMASAKSKFDINNACTAPIDRVKCCRRGNADGHSGCHNAKSAAVLRETWGKKSMFIEVFGCKTSKRRLLAD